MMRYCDMLETGASDRVPYFLRDFTLGMDVLGVRTTDVFTEAFDPKVSSDCICAFQNVTGQDAVIGCTHSPAFIIEQFGGEMRYPENGIPVPVSRPLSGVSDIKSIDTEFSGKILGAFDSYRLVKQMMDGIADVIGNVTGPLTKAGVLVGVEEMTMMMESDEDRFLELMDFCSEFSDRITERFCEDESVDSFLIAAATDNPDMFGFEKYRKYSVPFTERMCRKMHSYGYSVMYHPHGTFVSADTDLSSSILGMDIDGFHFAENNDPGRIAELFKGKMCIMGGTDIVPTLMGSIEGTVDETDRYLNTFRDNEYIFAASCSLHRGLPLDNIKAMCDRVRAFDNH